MRWKLLSVVVMWALASQASHAEDLLSGLTRHQNYESRRESSSNADLAKNNDNRPIEPGDTLVLADVEGPGIVTHFWNTVNAEDPCYGRSLTLRIYYDGNEQPSVQAPLGDFFGVGHGAQATYTSEPVAVSANGRARTCYWRMPFQKRFRMTVTNDSTEHRVHSFYYYLDWQKHETLPEDTAYFHAQYRQAMPAPAGNYVVADLKGRGHYVGTVYSVQQMEIGWFGEGDDFFYIDGAETPQLRGTGTEDYFCDAWGFREFSTAYFGVPLYEGLYAGDRVSAYRWHIPDPVAFDTSLRFELEHRGSIYTETAQMLGGFIERPDWISSVAFWYQSPPAQLEEAMPPVAERVAPYQVLLPAQLAHRAEPSQMLLKDQASVTYIPGKPEGTLSFDLEIKTPGRYQISGLFEFSLMGGVYQTYLDEQKIGEPLNFFIHNGDTLWQSLDLHDLKEGTHTLRFEAVAQPNAQRRSLTPEFHAMSVRRLFLLRLEDMEGYQQATKALKEAAETK